MSELFIRSVHINWEQIDRNSYVKAIPALQGLDCLDFSCPVTCFVGENGSGKSTLLEAIAVSYGFNAEGGSLNYSFSTYDSHSELCSAVRLIKGHRKAAWSYFLRAESFYNVATKTEDYRDDEPEWIYYQRYGGKSLHHQSHGESFMALAQANFQPDGLYILDEPEAALSPQRQLSLLAQIDQLSREGAQFVMVTHSPILLGLPDAQLLCFDDGPVHPVGYKQTQSYQTYEMFINHRESFLRYLRDEDENPDRPE